MNSAELNHLFVCDIPLLDVRAPVEFQKGAFPNAINAPILDDLQRTQVGLCYKQQGQDQAIELGHRRLTDALSTHANCSRSAFIRSRSTVK